MSHSAYKKYLKNPSASGQEIRNEYFNPVRDTSSVSIRIDDEEGWGDLLNPLLRLEARSYRKVGGFVRKNGERLEETVIQEQFNFLPPWPGGESSVTLDWNHLTKSLVGGSSIGGSNFVGPGARTLYFARPVSLFDLIAKIHDFAYEINGLVFNRPSQPEAFWSRLAKADWIFQQMLQAAGLEVPIHWLADRFAKYFFYGDPSLFRDGDRFINPIQAIPKSWLMAPPKYIVEEPVVHVRGPRRGQRQGILMRKPDPYVVTLSDKPDLWKELISEDVPASLTRALESLGENFPSDESEESKLLRELMEESDSWLSLSEDAWSKEIPYSAMA
ncbi:MAG: hypothetical protein AAGJ81_15570 [Verrucomicrobiota bacterium]